MLGKTINLGPFIPALTSKKKKKLAALERDLGLTSTPMPA
jgi:hypothetical protein